MSRTHLSVISDNECRDDKEECGGCCKDDLRCPIAPTGHIGFLLKLHPAHSKLVICLYFTDIREWRDDNAQRSAQVQCPSGNSLANILYDEEFETIYSRVLGWHCSRYKLQV